VYVRQIAIVNVTSGAELFKIHIKSPIGIYFHAQSGLVYVACYGKSAGYVYSYNKDTYSVNATYKHDGMYHPTGVARFEETLFVADQGANTVRTFSISSGLHVADLITIPLK
jgi:hypothetical protein